MAVELTMPKLGLTMTTGLLANWLVKDREPVRKGQPVFEIETDKATIEAQAPVDGIVSHVVQAGMSVPVGGLVGYILEPGELPMPEQETAPGEAVQSVGPDNQAPQISKTPPPASPAAKRRAKELNVDISMVTPQGDRITEADVERFAESIEHQTREDDRVKTAERAATPLAQRIAAANGINLGAVPGSGAKGAITKQDVEQAIHSKRMAKTDGMSPSSGSQAEDDGLIPIRGVRALIAERMLKSSQETAPVTLTTEADATELAHLRELLNEVQGDQLGFRISYNHILIKIIAQALKEYPYMNARQENGAIRLLAEIHIALAVDTESGLVAPVIRNAGKRTLLEIARDAHEKVEKARSGKCMPDDLTGSTFTLTNLGAHDIDAFTPIINPPELAILGVGRIRRKPAEYQGKIELRHQVFLSLTFDHRLIDGSPAGRFLKRSKELIENPYLSVLESIR